MYILLIHFWYNCSMKRRLINIVFLGIQWPSLLRVASRHLVTVNTYANFNKYHMSNYFRVFDVYFYFFYVGSWREALIYTYVICRYSKVEWHQVGQIRSRFYRSQIKIQHDLQWRMGFLGPIHTSCFCRAQPMKSVAAPARYSPCFINTLNLICRS